MGTASNAAKNWLRSILAVISGIAGGGAIVIGILSYSLPFPYWQSFFVTIPLILQAFGAIGVLKNWFKKWIFRAGRIINILEWFAGILGALAIFDLVMRIHVGRASWATEGISPMIFDTILILLFVLWMAVSHFINKITLERGRCEFC